IMSQLMIVGANSNKQAIPGEGFGFLPGTIVDQHFLKRNRKDRLTHLLSSYPKLVGLGIDENAVLVVQGRKLSVRGEKVENGKKEEPKVVVCMAAVGTKPVLLRELFAGDEEDLLALGRSAVARIEPRFSFEDETIEPELSHGTLVIVGGGDVPDE